MNLDSLSPMVRQYLETALWSSNDESTPAGGEPFDRNYDLSDIAPASIDQAVTDCDAFFIKASRLGILGDPQASDSSNLGHNFWLTRNGHGAGFWDGDYPEHGDELTRLCEEFREINPGLGDDGVIYFE